MQNSFALGVNYWDSESGTDMWKNWNISAVDADLAALETVGVRYLRVFPNWRDFQPIRKQYAWGNQFRCYVFGDEERDMLPDEDGIDPLMVQHFRDLAQCAEQHQMKLLVSLVTGWMSGRMFLPAAFEGQNPIKDPEVLMWTEKYVRGLVKALKDLPNIMMWDLGNECNCMGLCNRYEAYTWTAMVTNAIRSQDTTRPVGSGMHSLSAYDGDTWLLTDQGVLCDFVTTHPYPSPTIKGDIEPYNGMRTTMLPTAQSEYYAGISGRPCMIEEQGTFSSSQGNQKMQADFLRINVLSAWANSLTGYLWWCGMEHLKLTQSPYTWSLMERQLGLLDGDRKPKPVAMSMKMMSDLLQKLPAFGQKDTEAVCLLPRDDQKLYRAESVVLLAKQAGFNVQIRNSEYPAEKASLFIIPCISGWAPLISIAWNGVLKQVEDGADLYVSFDGGSMTEFDKVFGLQSNGMVKGHDKQHVAHFPFGDINYMTQTEILAESVGAKVLAVNEEGNVVFSVNDYGKGHVYYLGIPLESLAVNECYGFQPEKTQSYYKVYQHFAQKAIGNYVIHCDNPYLGVTQSQQEDGSYLTAVLNYSDHEIPFTPTIRDGWNYEVLYGDQNVIPRCDGTILRCFRNGK